MTEREQITVTDNGLLVLAPAKINLSLLVSGKREDGYHNIETIMAKLNWYDEVFIERAEKEGIELDCRGPRWAPEGKENIVYNACSKLLEYRGRNAGVRIILKKNIPAGSGLGSASSDAAATLIGVNRLFEFGLGKAELFRLALHLGSDVSFFLDGPLAFCTGRGEKIKKFEEKFDFSALLVLPDISVSTKMVYENYEHNESLYRSLSKQINTFVEKKRVDLAAKMCANMLQTSCFGLNERLAQLKERIETLIGERLCLSGSGSSMFYIFGQGDEEKAEENKRKISEKIGCESIVLKNNRW
jgi:4-diphosphocytidyl-2-C-methyl-D-erythritol kinase